MKWIDKDMERPEHGQIIDIYIDNIRICNCKFVNDDKRFVPYTVDQYGYPWKWKDVTHWMEIPKAPKI